MHRRITGKLVIATHNPGKLAEMRDLLAPYGIEAVSAGELGLAEPDETGDTFKANAAIKAIAAANVAQLPAFADDSGLVVDALDGAPGIYLGALGRRVQGLHRRDDAHRAPVAGARRDLA
jgi:XTP/dITP diphosphohydrolase